MSGGPSFRRVIVGTAGHIDHGKTKLVECLTGTRTDRLPEERARGMTIDVGYAEFRLPDGTEVGLLDVPGHERLVRTMVAGATSMDVVLLVVAADDGPMPQTLEHLDVIDLLGIRRGVVALSKIDAVDAGRVEAAEQAVRRLLRGTSLEAAPVVRVSSVTGEGVGDVREALVAAIPPADRPRADPRSFRMPVLRAFAVPGRGTVVTGIPAAGHTRVGRSVEVHPAGWTARVRSLQVHHRGVDDARSSHRVALLVPDLRAEAVKRGMVVADQGSLGGWPWVVGQLRCLHRLTAPLAHERAVRVHVGAADVRATLHVLNADRVPPGARTVVAFRGVGPFLVAPGDRFVLRSHNADVTLGGGTIIRGFAEAPARRQKGLVPALLERAARLDDPEYLVRATVQDAAAGGIDAPELVRATGLSPEGLESPVAALLASGAVVRHANRLHDPATLQDLPARVLSALARLHEQDPARTGVPTAAIRAAVDPVETGALRAVLASLAERGEVRIDPLGNVAAKDHVPQLPEADRRRCDQVHALYVRDPARPPTEREVVKWTGLSSSQARRTLKLLVVTGRLQRVGERHYDTDWFTWARGQLCELTADQGGFTVSQANRVLRTSRKYGVPFLEALDRMKLTSRAGDLRRLL